MAIRALKADQDGIPRTRISWYVGGRRISRVLRLGIEDSRAILARKLADRDLADNGQTIPRPFQEAVAEFLEDKRAAGCEPSYLEELTRTLSDVLAIRWRGRTVGEIGAAAVRDYLRDRGAEGVEAGTVKKDRTMLGTFFRWAIRRDFASRNPIDAVEVPRVRSRPPRLLTPAEYRKLDDAAPDYLRPILRVLVATGCRAEELCGLRRDKVRAGKILFDNRKCKDYVFVDCPPGLEAVLLGQPRTASGLVFERPAIYHGQAKRTDAWNADSLRRAIQAAAIRAGLVEDQDDQVVAAVSTHDLRHTAATWLLAAGVPIWDVKRTLGHRSVLTTERYSHVAGINWETDRGFLPDAMADYVPVVGRLATVRDFPKPGKAGGFLTKTPTKKPRKSPNVGGLRGLGNVG